MVDWWVCKSCVSRFWFEPTTYCMQSAESWNFIFDTLNSAFTSPLFIILFLSHTLFLCLYLPVSLPCTEEGNPKLCVSPRRGSGTRWALIGSVSTSTVPLVPTGLGQSLRHHPPRSDHTPSFSSVVDDTLCILCCLIRTFLLLLCK